MAVKPVDPATDTFSARKREFTAMEEHLYALIDELVTDGTNRHSTGGEDPETFIECALCFGWEGEHHEKCPIPLLERIINEQ